MMSDIFALYVRIHKAAAAAGDNDRADRALRAPHGACPLVGQVRHHRGRLESTAFPARTRSNRPSRWPPRLRAWHEGGAAAGDLAFWRRHVEQFRSPKAYALVIDTLLDHRDPVAAMALLVQWLSQADEIPLVEEDYSFHDLALLWMEDLWRSGQDAEEAPKNNHLSPRQRWSLARKFLDYLEANAGEYWHVPHLEAFAEGTAAR